MPIKGKNYIMVNERIKAFRQLYPEGTIETEILDLADGIVTMKATIKNIDVILGTGHAQEKESSTYINKTSFIENCETSAVGRALGMLGIGIDASFASYEEVANAQLNQNRAEQATQTTQRKPDTEQRKAEPKPNTEQRKQEADAYVAAEGKKITKAQLIDLGNKMAEYGIDAGYVKQKFKVENLSELTEQEYITITKNLDIIKTNSEKWRAKNAGQTA